VQLRVPPVPTTPGRVVLVLTRAVSEAVHPWPDIVTLYRPAVVIVGFCTEEVNPPGPVQLKVTPVTEDVAVNFTDELVHVIVPPLAVTAHVI
jgi:hypothetical protein